MKNLHKNSLENSVRQILLRRFIPSAAVVAVLAVFILCIIIFKAMSGPFQTKDIPGYVFLSVLLLGSASVTAIAVHQMMLYLSLLSATARKVHLQFPSHSGHGRAMRTLELLDDSNEKVEAAYQIIASNPEDLKEFPQNCEFDFFSKSLRGTERAIFSRTSYVIITYRHKPPLPKSPD